MAPEVPEALVLLTVSPDLGIPPLFQVVGAVARAVALMDNPGVGAVETVV